MNSRSARCEALSIARKSTPRRFVLPSVYEAGRCVVHSLVFLSKELCVSRLSLLSLMLVLLVGCGGASKSVSASLGAKSLGAINPPAYIPGPLDGESTPRALALRRPMAIIVENYDPGSRPQSGLSAASTVFETLAEGGVTRFMAIYLEHDASKVGPVRSTRIYFDHWASSLHSIFVHVGGNDDAQALLWHLPMVFNIDENRWEVNLYNTGTPLFWRSTDRVPPHNMYVNTKMLRHYAVKNRQDWVYNQVYLLHKHPAPLSHRGANGSAIRVTFEDPLYPHVDPAYAVRYVYDRASNTYLRFMGGSPHVGADTGKQLAPANVIIMHTGPAQADPAAGPTAESITIPNIGSGQAQFFRDGKEFSGTWKLPNQYAPLRFYDSRGRQVAFNPGQTWIEVAPPSSPVQWSAH